MSKTPGYSNIKHHTGNIITYTIENWMRKASDQTQLSVVMKLLPDLARGGWGNAYIGVPKGHKYYGVDYVALPIDCTNQEWTYSQLNMIENAEGIQEEYWCFGFDTMHFGQDLRNWPESKVIETIESMVPQFQAKELPAIYESQYDDYNENDI